MSLLSRFRIALALALSLVVGSTVQVGKVHAQKEEIKPEKKNVTFRTVDGVELKGTYWSSPNGKKNACVMLLHNFSKAKGGDSHQDGWDKLAMDLAKEGYNVLSFDFRGHGESTNVNKELFWDFRRFPHNQQLLTLKRRDPKDPIPTTIDYKEFPPAGTYVPHLVDDIAAAKAYLDNKAGDSAGNTILIGAGQGATLGAMWLSAQYSLYRDKAENPIMPRNLEAEPEGKDVASCVWLSISGRLENKNVPVDIWLEHAGGKLNKTPMLFMYGKDDALGKGNATLALTKMVQGYRMVGNTPTNKANLDSGFKHTRDWSVEGTKLTGSELLQDTLDTATVIKFYINAAMEDRGSKESKRREMEKFRYYWRVGNQYLPAKLAGEEFIMPIKPTMMGVR